MASNMVCGTRGFVADLRGKLSSGDRRTTGGLAIALLLALAPLSISQLLLALFGAVAYALLQPLAVPTARRPPPQKGVPMYPPTQPWPGKQQQQQQQQHYSATAGARRAEGATPQTSWRSQPGPGPAAKRSPAGAAGAAPLVLQPSVQPVAALVLEAEGWDAQVDELAKSMLPTPASERAVERLGARIQRGVKQLVPEAEVCCFASSAALRGGAFGVAVPDVDVVVSCAPATLVGRLCAGKGSGGSNRRQMQKTVLRAFTDRLVASGDFKFRRSAFSADEPKVTLLAAAGAQTEAIPLDLAVNSPTPLHNAALLTECGRLDPRARGLALMARRWARHRGICHSARGHLSPYCWTVMAIYFLQVGEEEGAPVLPPLRGFRVASSLVGEAAEVQEEAVSAEPGPRDASKSLGALFREFLCFYAARFDVRKEAVSVRLGRRAAPGPRLPVHVVVDEKNGKTEVAPSIEDPFDATRNLAAGMSAMGVARLREELDRASSLLAGGAQLSELLELWSPPGEAGEGDAASP